MRVRSPVVAGRFYPARRADCVREIESCLPQRPSSDLPQRIIAGVVPHAGWSFSGPTAAQVYTAIHSQRSPSTFVLLSAMHGWNTIRSAVYGGGAWSTPLGEAPIDAELAQAVLDAGKGLLVDSPSAHDGEHSAEVQVPFIQHLFPQAHILPILVPPDEQAVEVGEVIARAVAAAEKDIVIIGTTDLTHYGAMYYGFAPAGTGAAALEWTRTNDARVIRLMLQMQAEGIVPETRAHRNACGGGAVAATVAAARALGAQKGVLLEYTTSHHVMPRGEATDFVGYAAVVF